MKQNNQAVNDNEEATTKLPGLGGAPSNRRILAGQSTGILMLPGAKSLAETAAWSLKKTFPIRAPNGRTETTAKTVLEWDDR